MSGDKIDAVEESMEPQKMAGESKLSVALNRISASHLVGYLVIIIMVPGQLFREGSFTLDS